MNVDTADDFSDMLAASLASAIKEYHLKVIPIDAARALLVGVNYALLFTVERGEGIEIQYIERDHHAQLQAYSLRSFMMQRLSEEDRASYASSSGLRQIMVASLNLHASCLVNRCHDLLSGDKSWLRRAGWIIDKPDKVIAQALQEELKVDRG